MLAEALQAEVDAYIARFGGEHDERGRRLVVRNGSHQPREVLTAAGAVEVRPPRANDRRTDHDTGERARFCSAILPAVGAEDPEDLHPTGDTDQCGLRVIGGGLPSMLRIFDRPDQRR